MTAEDPKNDAVFNEEWVLHRRFDRMGRLLGDQAMQRLLSAHVVVVGMGGVGSFAAEALVRSGIGHLTLVDFDLICITNSNRQLHAMQGTIGHPKVEVMAERLLLINPKARIDTHFMFYEAGQESLLLAGAPHFVVDAIDNLTAKCHLLSTCKAQRLPVITCTGSANKLDPTQIRIAELSLTTIDPLAREVRSILRKQHGFPQEGPMGIPAFYSTEPPRTPVGLAYDAGAFSCICPQGNNEHHSCERRHQINGTAGFVTGAFGLAAAAYVVQSLATPAAV